MTTLSRSTLAASAALVLALTLPETAHGQDRPAKRPPAEAPADSMQVSMDAMMPMMGQMMMAMMNAMLDVAAQPETAEKMATFSKNYFDALMRKGFTRDESLRIVMAARLPSMPGQN